MADREEIPAVWGEDGDHSINHSGLMSTEKYELFLKLPYLFTLIIQLLFLLGKRQFVQILLEVERT